MLNVEMCRQWYGAGPWDALATTWTERHDPRNGATTGERAAAASLPLLPGDRRDLSGPPVSPPSAAVRSPRSPTPSGCRRPPWTRWPRRPAPTLLTSAYLARQRPLQILALLTRRPAPDPAAASRGHPTTARLAGHAGPTAAAARSLTHPKGHVMATPEQPAGPVGPPLPRDPGRAAVDRRRREPGQRRPGRPRRRPASRPRSSRRRSSTTWCCASWWGGRRTRRGAPSPPPGSSRRSGRLRRRHPPDRRPGSPCSRGAASHPTKSPTHPRHRRSWRRRRTRAAGRHAAAATPTPGHRTRHVTDDQPIVRLELRRDDGLAVALGPRLAPVTVAPVA